MLIALALAAAPPAASQATPATVGAEAQARPDSVALVAALNPEGPMLDTAVRMFQTGMRAAIENEQAYIDLEKDHPGISAALIEAMTRAARADLLADMPALQRRYASFYANRFTPDETAELLRFYGSKLGQRLVAGKHAKMDGSGLMAEIMENPDAEVSGRQIGTMNRDAALAVVQGLSPAELAELQAFARRPVFLKLNQARPAIEQLEAEIANEPDPGLDKALDDAMNEVFVKFTGEPLPEGD